ncbi:MAG: tRNA (adenosine(37)-N6)-threonylcarbamoyltransferase complex dimerization subunit type 1 TsaB [Schwartzia sp.]|nr:tRNA (adenosine(37)-N6)-threonylcarbamoyltransferase complex dimerization subunit type 1 TsaB [Schwartzia sp. (in: firmicutes)]
MVILAIETATIVSSVAVAEEGKLLAEVTAAAKLTHSETLQPHIKQAMEMARVKREDIGAIAVSLGPGSFTGLRIGLAAAKGLAYAWGVPIVGVPTLEAMAENFPVPGAVVVPLIDAQKGNAYMACYSRDEEGLKEVQPIEIIPLDEVVKRCGAMEKPVIICGDMTKKLADKELPKNVRTAPFTHMLPRSATVAALGLERLAKGEQDNVMNLEPFYIRRSEAEVLWEKRHPEADL